MNDNDRQRGRFEGEVVARLDNLNEYIESVSRDVKENNRMIIGIKEDLAQLKVKSSLWGSITGGGAAGVMMALKSILRGDK